MDQWMEGATGLVIFRRKEEAMDDAKSKMEKRAIQSFNLQLPVTVTTRAGNLNGTMAESRDVSSHGICFYCDRALEPGSSVGFTIVLPREVTMSDALRIRGDGTVVRSEASGHAEGSYMVAISIESYEFVADDELSETGGAIDAPPSL